VEKIKGNCEGWEDDKMEIALIGEYKISREGLETSRLFAGVGIYLWNTQNKVKGLMHFRFPFDEEAEVNYQFELLEKFLKNYKKAAETEDVCATLFGGKAKVNRKRRVLKKDIKEFPKEWGMKRTFLDMFAKYEIREENRELFYYSYLRVKNTREEEFVDSRDNTITIRDILEKKGIKVEVREKENEFREVRVQISDDGKKIIAAESREDEVIDNEDEKTEKELIELYRKLGVEIDEDLLKLVD